MCDYQPALRFLPNPGIVSWHRRRGSLKSCLHPLPPVPLCTSWESYRRCYGVSSERKPKALRRHGEPRSRVIQIKSSWELLLPWENWIRIPLFKRIQKNISNHSIVFRPSWPAHTLLLTLSCHRRPCLRLFCRIIDLSLSCYNIYICVL